MVFRLQRDIPGKFSVHFTSQLYLAPNHILYHQSQHFEYLLVKESEERLPTPSSAWPGKFRADIAG